MEHESGQKRVAEGAQRAQRSIWLVMAAFVALALAASIINPLHEATDELRHYRFVQHIVQRQSLPVQGEVGCSAQGHHPPLFYTLGALATFWIDTGRDVCYEPSTNPFWAYRYWEVGRDNKNQYLHGADEAFPWRGEALAAHMVRAVNVLLGAGVVYITWLMGRAIWPQRPFLALGSAAFVAFNPMFVYMAGAINNDVLAALSGSAVTLACVRLLQDKNGLSRRWGVTLGVLFGLALLSKFNLAALAVLIAAAVTWVAWRRRQWRSWLEVGLIIGGVTLLLAGWWFVRNQILFGEPTGVERLTELWGVRDPRESFGVAIFELSYLWTSLWGRFGYGQVPLPDSIYVALRWVVGIGLAGLALLLLRRQRAELRRIGPALLLLALNCLLFFGVIFNYLLISPAGPMGRFFFPALPSLAVLTFYGWSRWETALRERLAGLRERGAEGAALAVLANGAMLALTVAALWVYLRPAYARPATFGPETAVPQPVDAQFDTLIKLRGYEVGETAVRPGEPINVDLYWEVTGRPPGNFYFFVHLIDKETGVMVAQRDTHPGVGHFPSSLWQPGDRWIESIQLYVPETAYAPATATLSVGFYAPEGYRLGITAADGVGAGDALPLETITIVPRAGEFPNPLDQNFNGEIKLVGYAYSARELDPGEALAVKLYWRDLPAVNADYLVRLRLLDEAGNVWAEENGRPQEGQAPTTGWSPGQVIRDTHTLALDPTLPPGSYQVEVALINAVTQTPQNIIAEDGHWIDNRLLLARVQLRP